MSGRLHSNVSVTATEHQGRGLDLVAAIIFLIVMPLDLPLVQPARAPVAILLLAYAALHWRETLVAQKQGLILLAIPAVCALSSLWAPEPLLALRYAGLFLFSFGIAGVLGVRLGIKDLVVALMLSQGLLAVASLVTMTTMWVGGKDGVMVLVGVFPHKNVAGVHMLFLAVSSVLVLGMASTALWSRLVAMVMLPISLFFVVKSGSATAQLLILGGVPLALFLLLVWQLAKQVEGGRSVLVLGLVALSSGAALVASNTILSDPVGLILEGVGRDKTITGRTEIWQIANEVVDEHPVLGVGAGNFWRADNGDAQKIASRFYAQQVESFSFHNVLMEIRVHLGFVGVLTIVPAYLWLGWKLARRWLFNQQTTNVPFVVVLSLVTVQLFVESELFRPMTFTSILFFLIGYVAISAQRLEVGQVADRHDGGQLAPA